MKITIAGAGYVSLSNALLLSQHHELTLLEIVAERVDQMEGLCSGAINPDTLLGGDLLPGLVPPTR